eukprot:gnl/TRDRNA2_/TRDRNA2_57879_c0_seq1.p1 gnl/TRDRNA2_/TRDRNA2_57879_c0~~gnl/TRDRNA2_/TRDRNA2_57879_c0_seq1.p1  ORF type:complete len:301 (-),score=5.07 gnl/TRDRNA2_/TRDRNA2_57879_c0_seq1:39-845(-)
MTYLPNTKGLLLSFGSKRHDFAKHSTIELAYRQRSSESPTRFQTSISLHFSGTLAGGLLTNGPLHAVSLAPPPQKTVALVSIGCCRGTEYIFSGSSYQSFSNTRGYRSWSRTFDQQLPLEALNLMEQGRALRMFLVDPELHPLSQPLALLHYSQVGKWELIGHVQTAQFQFDPKWSPNNTGFGVLLYKHRDWDGELIVAAMDCWNFLQHTFHDYLRSVEDNSGTVYINIPEACYAGCQVCRDLHRRAERASNYTVRRQGEPFAFPSRL